MKKNIFNLLSAFLAIAVLFSACTPEKFEMGSAIAKDQLEYSITQDPNDPNMVILVSQNPGMTPLWVTPTGRSTRVIDTIKLAFPGDYVFKYGVQSDGGFVQADEVTVSITTTNTDYIKDPSWILLSGGVGNEKTWYLDLDADGVSRYFDGPLYFYGTNNGWLGNCEVDEGDCWNWNPDYPGNSWLMSTGDYGSITFDLKGNANVTANHLMLGRTETGTYSLDADAHTLSMVDVGPLHDAGRDGQVVNWGDLKILSLTEDYMQLAALRDEALSGEGPCLLVYNFISKDYFDNWVPEEEAEPEPELPENWQEDVSSIVNSNIKWVLSPDNPFNWVGLDGAFLNTGWDSPADYPDWTGFNASVPATYADFSLTMNSSTGAVVYVSPDGSSTEGTYTLDEEGYYTFDGVTPGFNICSWVNLFVSDQNQWRVVKVEKDAAGAVTGIWVGVRDAVKPEYMAFHLVPEAGGGSDPFAVWKEALDGKTFTPDVNWFVDWVSEAPDFTGGWTSSSTFGDDYTSNGWIWDASTRAIAESASLKFFLDGEQMYVTVSQSLTTEHDDNGTWVTDNVDASYSVTGKVYFDIENSVLAITVPLIDYAGSPARWLNSEGNQGGEWNFVSHGGSTLANIDTEGLWLGYASSDTETTIMHYVIKN